MLTGNAQTVKDLLGHSNLEFEVAFPQGLLVGGQRQRHEVEGEEVPGFLQQAQAFGLVEGPVNGGARDAEFRADLLGPLVGEAGS